MFTHLPTLMERLLVGRNIPRRLALCDRLPRRLVERIQEAEFQQTVSLAARRSRFYRDGFAAAAIRPDKVRRPQDLGEFYTTSADLRAHDTEDFLCGEAQAGFETTGTTARNKRIYFSNEEVRDMGLEGAVGLWNLGLRPDDRVVDAFDYAFWNAGISLLHSLEAVGCFHVIGSKLEPAEFYRRVKPYGFNVLIVDTAWLVALTEIAEREGVWPVKFILSGSENMSEATRNWVQRVWSTRVYQAYGQTESLGASGIECPAQRGYHLNEFHFLFELRNPNPDGYGELVFSTLTRKVMPLVRYRTNDITRFVTEPCGCPLEGMRRIDKVVGRGDEIVSCGMGMISPWIFETWLRDLPDLADDWQAAVRQPGPRDAVELRLEWRENTRAPSPQELEAMLLRRLEERFPYYYKNHRMGLFDLNFVLMPRGSLRAAGARRKLRRVVDERLPNAARNTESSSTAHAVAGE